MPTWQVFLLGVMVAYTPGMIFLAIMCHQKDFVVRGPD
jgi:hypothetical protein